MKIAIAALIVVVVCAVTAGAYFFSPVDVGPIQLSSADFNVKRGAYLARMAGCVACHTKGDDGTPLGGGVALETPFGTFFSPNITPDRTAGIGTWTIEDLARAVRFGVSPDGEPYYPAFPHMYYASMNDRDIGDLWAALQIVPPESNPAPEHDLSFPFNFRPGLKLWRAFFFDPQDLVSDETRSASWNRGRFIAELAHCGACHTPRNLAGASVVAKAYGGDPEMMDGGSSPAIDPVALRENGWTKQGLVTMLKSGLMPDGDVVGGSMAEVVRDGTAYLLPQHLDDLATFLLDERQTASAGPSQDEVTK